MKTNTKNKKSGLQSRSEQLSANSTIAVPKIDWELKRQNRQMATDKLLEALRVQSPRLWEVAEVVGNWVWVRFQDKQPREITFPLSQLGFHWNNKRQAWQHPCGTIVEEGATYDPRRKYHSYFPADAKAA